MMPAEFGYPMGTRNEAAVCCHLCRCCLQGIALMGKAPNYLELAFTLPLLGEWVSQTYGDREHALSREVRA